MSEINGNKAQQERNKAMRLIDADELKRNVTSWLRPVTDEMNMVDADNITVSVIMEIEEAPTVDPVMHGYWIRDGHHIICSQCGTAVCNRDYEGNSFPISYCMHCGTTMDLPMQ